MHHGWGGARFGGTVHELVVRRFSCSLSWLKCSKMRRFKIFHEMCNSVYVQVHDCSIILYVKAKQSAKTTPAPRPRYTSDEWDWRQFRVHVPGPVMLLFSCLILSVLLVVVQFSVVELITCKLIHALYFYLLHGSSPAMGIIPLLIC